MSNLESLTESDTNYINVLFLNVRSLKNKLNEIYGLVNNMVDIGVIILGETWLTSEETTYFSLPNFEAVFNCRDGKQGGGTAIYVRKNLKFRTIELNPNFNKIIIEVFMDKQKIKIMTLYRPPSSNINEFLEELETTCESFKNGLIVGDMNIDILNTTTNSVAYKNTLEYYSFRILNTLTKNKATRCSTSSATIIDHLATDLPDCYFSKPIDIKSTCISDHNLISFSVAFKTLNKKKSEMKIKEFKKVDNPKFIEYVRQATNNVNTPSISELIDIIQKGKELASTTIKKRVRKDSFEWMSLDILKLMEKRDKIYKQLKRSPYDPTIKQAFDEVDSKVKHDTKEAKTKHFHEKVMRSDNSKKLWNAINDELGVRANKTTKSISEIITDDGNLISNKGEIASSLNDYFVKFR